MTLYITYLEHKLLKKYHVSSSGFVKCLAFFGHNCNTRVIHDYYFITVIIFNESLMHCVLFQEKPEEILPWIFPFFFSFLLPLLKTSIACELETKGRWL